MSDVGGAPGATGDEAGLRRSVLDVLRSAGASGLTAGTSGNASARCGDAMVISPSAVPYPELSPDDLATVSWDGTASGPRSPSSEWRLHAAIYRARPEVSAVVHLHSPAATALASQRRGLPPFHYMVAVAGGADVRCAPYRLFGTAELAEVTLEALEGRTACLLANHGQVAVGPSPQRALALAVEIEALCDQYLRACAAGGPVLLTPADMDQALERFGQYRSGTLR